MIWGRKLLVVTVPLILAWLSFGMRAPSDCFHIIFSLPLSERAFSGTSLAMLGGLIQPSPLRIPDQSKHWFYPIGTAAFSIALAVNAIIATLLTVKIFMMYREHQRSTIHKGRVNPLRATISILNESGMMMLACQIIWLVLFRKKEPAFFLVRGPIVMIYVKRFIFVLG